MDNSTLATAFFEEFFNQHDFSAVDKYLHPDYIQHDYDMPDGKEGFREHFAHIFEIFPKFRVELMHVISEDDMVVVHGYGVMDPGKREVLVVDTYRVQDQKLVEHWGTVQPLPPEQFGNARLF